MRPVRRSTLLLTAPVQMPLRRAICCREQARRPLGRRNGCCRPRRTGDASQKRGAKKKLQNLLLQIGRKTKIMPFFKVVGRAPLLASLRISHRFRPVGLYGPPNLSTGLSKIIAHPADAQKLLTIFRLKECLSVMERDRPNRNHRCASNGAQDHRRLQVPQP